MLERNTEHFIQVKGGGTLIRVSILTLAALEMKPMK